MPLDKSETLIEDTFPLRLFTRILALLHCFPDFAIGEQERQAQYVIKRQATVNYAVRIDDANIIFFLFVLSAKK